MITGEFTRIMVPSEISIGEDLIIKVRFSANNPDGSLFRPWKTFLIADIPVMGRYELDAARRYFKNIDTGEKTYNLGPVPSINADEFAVSLFIFGHWDANYDWDWGEYDAWLDGWPVSFTHLDSEYRFVTVTEPPPEPPEPPPGAVFAGRIISVEPLEQRVNSQIDLIVKYEVETFSLFEAINGWEAEAVITVDGQEGKAQSGYLFGKGPKTLTQRVSFGTMLETNMYGTVDIICYKGGFSSYNEVVDSKSIILVPSDLPPAPPPGNGPPPPGEEEMNWLPIVLIGGGVAVALIALSKPRKKQP